MSKPLSVVLIDDNPARAEIVIEGWISPDPATFEIEGPFGEYTGYFGGDKAMRHTVRVTAITHRNDPIMRGTLEGNADVELLPTAG